MGLIYIPGDANQVETQLTNDLQMSEAFLNRLKEATSHLTAIVGGGKLDGKAYKKGLGLMQDCVLPTIQHTTSAIDGIKQDLSSFSRAKSGIPNEPLYEDKLNAHIAELEAQKAAQTALSAVYQSHILSLIAGPVGAAVDKAIHQFTDAKNQLSSWGNSVEEEIRKTKEKRDKLRQFNSVTNSLFHSSVSNLKIAMQGVMVLNGSKINSDGSYKLPMGMDSSYFKRVHKKSEQYLDLYNDVETLLKGDDGDNIRRMKMILSAYPAAVVKKLLKSDEFWMLANKLPDGGQSKLISILAKYEEFGQAVAVGKWIPKINTLGKIVEVAGKWTTPLKSVVGAGLKQGTKALGKVGPILTWIQLGTTFVSSSASNYAKTKNLGKATIGGAIDTVKSIGPLEGMSIGAQVGGLIGTAIPIPGVGTVSGLVVGAVAGGVIGGANTVMQFIWPHAYDDLKKGAYSLYDKGAGVINNIGKSIATVKFPKVKWGW